MRTKVETAMQQAPMTVSYYMSEAITSIDSNFGFGYSRSNPLLVAAFITGCIADFSIALDAMNHEESCHMGNRDT